MAVTTPINYIELPVTDMATSKAFYSEAFGWTYEDYGPTYAAFTNAGIDGGFDAASDRKPSSDGASIDSKMLLMIRFFFFFLITCIISKR